MHIERLRLARFRNIASLDLALSPGFNYFFGDNGAGKTSIVESVYLLGYGRSFRSGQNAVLISRGGGPSLIAADISKPAGIARTEFAFERAGWRARINGDPVPQLSQLLSEIAVVCFEPGSHELISGGSLMRRAALDWILFHVEPNYLSTIRQYRRALQQRNAALKQNGGDSEIDVWDTELARAGEKLSELREMVFSDYALELSKILRIFLNELGTPQIVLERGWSSDKSLIQALSESRGLDRLRGHTSRGPHRGDWSIRFDLAPTREELSRGQEKLCALAAIVAQARVYAARRHEWPVVILDDLASELDRAHQDETFEYLGSSGAQVLVTGIDAPAKGATKTSRDRVFHVEHGTAVALL